MTKDTGVFESFGHIYYHVLSINMSQLAFIFVIYMYIDIYIEDNVMMPEKCVIPPVDTVQPWHR